MIIKFMVDIPAIEQAQITFTDFYYPSFKLYVSIKISIIQFFLHKVTILFTSGVHEIIKCVG